MQEYMSKTDRILGYIREVLADEKKHSTKEIIEYVDSKLKENGEFVFQVNSYVNAAMRILMKNEDYAKVAYGMYQKGGIPYTPSSKRIESESDLEKIDVRSAMVSVKAYAKKIEELFARKSPFTDMDTNEEASYWAIKKHSLDVAKSLRGNADKLFQMADSQYQNERNQTIRKYFEECLSDGNPHKMNDIKDYIFSKMMENNEYNGERSSAYIYPAISSLIVEGGPYQKIARGVYQISQEIQQSDSVYSMDDVSKLLDRGCNLAERDIKANLIANPVYENEHVIGAVIVILDVTEYTNREKMRSEFTSNVSHELKSPLTSISGFAEIMMAGDVPGETVVDFSKTIYKEAQRLISLVSDIIKISELDEKNTGFEQEPVELFELSKSVTERMKPVAEKRNITLNVLGGTAKVMGVSKILEEMIENLVDNAVKYNKDNGTVDVIVTSSDNTCELVVRDTGIGIPQSEQSRVFERFYCVDKSHSKLVGGTGLGLSIVKHGAMFHEAQIKLESTEGKGTSISLIFNKA